MSQHDMTISDADGATVLADLNGAVQALASQSSGATAPPTTYAHQFWADTTAGLMKQRNAANSGWFTVGTLGSPNWGLLPLAGGTLTGPLNWAKGANLASAGTLDLDAATGNYLLVTGTTTVTAVTLAAGAARVLLFASSLTLTHSANLLLPNGGSNIQTATGDLALLESDGGGVVRVAFYTRADGTTLGGAQHKVVVTTYDVSTTGSLAVTGAGFRPKEVTVYAAVNGTKASSTGTFDGATGASVSSNANNTAETVAVSSAFCSVLLTAAGTQALLAGASLDADGATFTRTKSGSPTGTATLICVFRR